MSRNRSPVSRPRAAQRPPPRAPEEPASDLGVTDDDVPF